MTAVYQAPPLATLQADTKLPTSTEVVVIGGEIAGTSTALFLSQRGVPTVLCEKGQVSAEQSSRNWGWVRTMGRDPRESPLMAETMRLWDRMAGTVGADVGFRQSGILYLCEDEHDIEKQEM